MRVSEVSDRTVDITESERKRHHQENRFRGLRCMSWFPHICIAGEVPISWQFSIADGAIEPRIFDDIALAALRAKSEDDPRRKAVRMLNPRAIQCSRNSGPRFGFGAETGRLIGDLHHGHIVIDRNFTGGKHRTTGSTSNML